MSDVPERILLMPEGLSAGLAVRVSSDEIEYRRADLVDAEIARLTRERDEAVAECARLREVLENSARWRDVADELPQEAQEVLFVRYGKTVHGAWIGGCFWHNNQQMAAAKWMPLPKP